MIVIHTVRIDETVARAHPIRCVEGGNYLFHMLDKAKLGLTDSLWVVPVPGGFDLID